MAIDTDPYVTLAAEVTVNGRTLYARHQVHPEVWATPELREHPKQEVLRTLGEKIVRALDPSIFEESARPEPERVLRRALAQAEAQESALRELHRALRGEGYAYASASAYDAAEAVHALVQQLREDAGVEERRPT